MNRDEIETILEKAQALIDTIQKIDNEIWSQELQEDIDAITDDISIVLRNLKFLEEND